MPCADEYREVFVLFHEQGQSYEEIAQVVDRPVGTVKTWLHRARLELLERLRTRGLVPDEPAPRPPPTADDPPMNPDREPEIPVPPVCGPTMDRLNSSSTANCRPPHSTPTRTRPRARRAASASPPRELLLSVLAAPRNCLFPPGLADRILSAVREDRYARIRAALLRRCGRRRPSPSPRRSCCSRGGYEHRLRRRSVPLGPTRRLRTWRHVAPEPRPLRIGDEFAKVGQAILGSSKPITEPAASARGCCRS